MNSKLAPIPSTSSSKCSDGRHSDVTTRPAIGQTLDPAPFQLLADCNKTSVTAQEYTLMIRPTRVMAQAYNLLLDSTTERNSHRYKPLMSNILNHPYFFHENPPHIDKSEHKLSMQSETIHHDENGSKPDWISVSKRDWFKKFATADDWMNIGLSNKFVLFFKILAACVDADDKLIVISHSLKTLDLIEKCLMGLECIVLRGKPLVLNWRCSSNYLRLKQVVEVRSLFKLIKKFNDPANKETRLILMSPEEADYGIDLTGANRAIIFDTKEGYEDSEVLNRIFRPEQTKNVYVYRFVTKDTFEEKVFNMQMPFIKKSFQNLQKSIEFRPKEEYPIPSLSVPQDPLLAKILSGNGEQNCGEVLEWTVHDPSVKVAKKKVNSDDRTGWPRSTRAVGLDHRLDWKEKDHSGWDDWEDHGSSEDSDSDLLLDDDFSDSDSCSISEMIHWVEYDTKKNEILAASNTLFNNFPVLSNTGPSQIQSENAPQVQESPAKDEVPQNIEKPNESEVKDVLSQVRDLLNTLAFN